MAEAIKNDIIVTFTPSTVEWHDFKVDFCANLHVIASPKRSTE